MSETLPSIQIPIKYEVEVQAQGHIELQVPFAQGQKIIVLVMPEEPENFDDLVAASTSSLEFWNNSIDDQVWNNA